MCLYRVRWRRHCSTASSKRRAFLIQRGGVKPKKTVRREAHSNFSAVPAMDTAYDYFCFNGINGGIHQRITVFFSGSTFASDLGYDHVDSAVWRKTFTNCKADF